MKRQTETKRQREHRKTETHRETEKNRDTETDRPIDSKQTLCSCVRVCVFKSHTACLDLTWCILVLFCSPCAQSVFSVCDTLDFLVWQATAPCCVRRWWPRWRTPLWRHPAVPRHRCCYCWTMEQVIGRQHSDWFSCTRLITTPRMF